jgi:kinesin family protein 6/9
VKDKLMKEYVMQARDGGEGGTAAAAGEGGAPAEGGAGVGDVDRGDGFSVGVAPSSAVPKSSVGAHLAPAAADASATAPEPEEGGGAEPPPPVQEPAALSRPAAFDEYKASGAGATDDAQLEENKAQHREKKRRAKELSATVNGAQREIVRLKTLIEDKKAAREADPAAAAGAGDAEVIDEEEFAYFKQLKEQKAVYRAAFGELKQEKEEAQYLSQLVETCRRKLISGFEQWYAARYGAEEPVVELGPAVDESGEVLDYGEQFDKMEMEKITAEDPDSVSFYNARKAVNSRKNRPAHRAANAR